MDSNKKPKQHLIDMSEGPSSSFSDGFMESDFSQGSFSSSDGAELSIPSEFAESVDELSSSSDNGDQGQPLTEPNNIPIDEDTVYNIWGQVVGTRRKDIGPDGSSLDMFLERHKDTNEFFRTVYDPAKGYKKANLTPEEEEMIRNIMVSRPYNDAPGLSRMNIQSALVNKNIMRTALTSDVVGPKEKYASKAIVRKIEKLREGIERGEIVYDPNRYKVDENRGLVAGNRDLWADVDETEDPSMRIPKGRGEMYMNPTKPKLPGHALSYNPPLEYLNIDGDGTQQKLQSLRQIKTYTNFVKDQFDRCLTLYLNPRQRLRKEENIDSMLPTLPDRSLLTPYPTFCAMTIRTGTRRINGLTFSPKGMFFAVGGRDCILRIFETYSGRQVRAIPVLSTKKLEKKSIDFLNLEINCCKWCPRTDVSIIAVCAGDELIFVDAGICESGNYNEVRERTRSLLNARPEATQPCPHMAWEMHAGVTSGGKSHASGFVTQVSSNAYNEGSEDDDAAESARFNEERYQRGHEGQIDADVYTVYTRLNQFVLLRIHHTNLVSFCNWHFQGDYIVTVCTDDKSRAKVTLHQLSKWHSLSPFNRLKSKIIGAHFRTRKSELVVVSERSSRIYNLLTGDKLSTLYPGVKQVTASAMGHGDNFITGSADSQCALFANAAGPEPTAKLCYHTSTIRNIDVHSCGGLVATCSDDGIVQVSRIVDASLVKMHPRQFDEKLYNKMIPCTVLNRRRQSADGSVGISRVTWHPTQPWLLCSGTDGVLRLFK